MTKKSFFLSILMITSSLLYAQLSDIEFEELINQKDLVILNEGTELSFTAKKAYFLGIKVKKDITYQVLKNSGNDKINPLRLPGRLDEVYIPHNSTIRNEQRMFDGVEVQDFAAWLVKQDGTEEKIKFGVTMEENTVITSEDRFGKIYSYRYSFPQFTPGDVVRLSYSYTFHFKENWQKLISARIFLETNIPRKEYNLTFSHHNRLVMETNYFNDAVPDQFEIDGRSYYKWTYKNQPGCIREPGARPYTELPYFTFCPKPYEFLYTHFNSFIEEFIPLWYFLSFDRESKVRKAYVDYDIGVQNRDNHNFQRVAQRYKNMVEGDSACLARLRYFQRYIVDSARYDDAYTLFNRTEGNRKLSPGGDLLGGLVREPNKEFVYANMLPRIGCQYYFTAYLDDVRSGQISETYFAPAYDNEMLFAFVTEKDEIVFVVPKSDTRDLYCEELPFYYENAPVMLLFTYDFAGYKRNFSDIFRVIRTPGSTASDNYRKVNSMVSVDLNLKKLNFNTRISLSGQYSTLTYPVYTNAPTDNTINPKYLNKIWDIGKDVEVKSIQANGKQFYYPFKSSVTAKYSRGISNNGGDGFIEFDIGNWIKHIYYENIHTKARFTDFYADFPNSDIFNYMIQFDAPVAIAEMPAPIEIDNAFGIYKFTVNQTNERGILVTSYFLAKSTKINKAEISQVQEIYNAFEQLKSSKLLVKLTQE